MYIQRYKCVNIKTYNKMEKKIKQWFKNNYSANNVVLRMRWIASAIGVISPINALTEKQLKNT